MALTFSKNDPNPIEIECAGGYDSCNRYQKIVCRMNWEENRNIIKQMTPFRHPTVSC